MGARYSTESPNALPQSLAKTTAEESNSQAGEELLQLPPASSSVLPVDRLLIQSCSELTDVFVKAAHLRSGDTI